MALQIQRFNTTERIKQIFFLQMIDRIKNTESLCDLKLDFESVEALHPGFLHSHNFTDVSVSKLFEFITYETRSGAESIYRMEIGGFACFPEFLYGFSDNEHSSENLKWDEFPLLYDRFEESSTNALVAMYLNGSLYMYNKDGIFLDVTKHPNLYDDGFVRPYFFDESYLAIEDYDENNLAHVELYNYKKGRLEQIVVSTIELLQLMESQSINWGFENLSESLRDDKNIVLLAFSNHKTSNMNRTDLLSVSKRFRDDDDVARAAVDACVANYEYLSDRLQLNESLALKFIHQYPYRFDSIPRAFKMNKEFILKAIAANAEVIDYIGSSFQGDKEIVLLAAKAYPLAYAYYLPLAPPDFFQNKTSVLEVVSKYPMAIRHLSDELKNDRDIAAAAIKKNVATAEFIPALKYDREFLFKMIAINGNVISYLEKFREDESFALDCVKKNGLNLRFFSDAIRNSKQIVLEAYKQNKDAIFFATDALKIDIEIRKLLGQQESNKPEQDDLPF